MRSRPLAERRSAPAQVAGTGRRAASGVRDADAVARKLELLGRLEELGVNPAS